MSTKIGFIGAGQMARALARGMVAAGVAKAEELIAADPIESARGTFAAEMPGARLTAENAEVWAAAEDLVLVAVKPQMLAGVLADPAARRNDRLVVSIVAGARIARFAEALGHKRIVRVMPNTPCLVGSGASGYACGEAVQPADRRRVEQLLGAVGIALAVHEEQLDAVTGLSGSGPADVYVLIEGLSDGGGRMGLPREAASKLAAQTVLGAAQMVLETGEHPAVLRERVTSPGGTTIAGLQALEDRAFRGALLAAVQAATERSRELG